MLFQPTTVTVSVLRKRRRLLRLLTFLASSNSFLCLYSSFGTILGCTARAPPVPSDKGCRLELIVPDLDFSEFRDDRDQPRSNSSVGEAIEMHIRSEKMQGVTGRCVNDIKISELESNLNRCHRRSPHYYLPHLPLPHLFLPLLRLLHLRLLHLRLPNYTATNYSPHILLPDQ